MPAIRQLIIAVFVLTIAGASFWLYKKDINPLDWESVKSEWRKTRGKVEDISRIIENPDAPDKSQTKIYRRKDANGNWYYTNEPPKEGEESGEQVYRTDTNVMPVPEKLKKKE